MGWAGCSVVAWVSKCWCVRWWRPMLVQCVGTVRGCILAKKLEELSGVMEDALWCADGSCLRFYSSLVAYMLC